MSKNDKYIPPARDAVIAYFGHTSSGAYRMRCVTCCDAAPLIGPAKIYGDLYVASGPESRADGEACETCGVTLLALSERCQREHDEQQARWAREAPVDHVVEYGCVTAVRCRVY